MCQNFITTVVAGKCRHKIEELPTLELCDEALARGGTPCEEAKDIHFGQKTTKEFCPNCQASEEQNN